MILPSIPAGRYYLRVEPEHDGPGQAVNYTITVRRDVPRKTPFLLALIFLVIPPILAWFRAFAFEQARWKESDHAPTTDSDDDDDD